MARAAPTSPGEHATVTDDAQSPQIPGVLNEETLPAVQKAGAKEARNLVAIVQTGKPVDETCSWQFELVRRQQHLHQRDEARRMLVVFLSVERKTWPHITKTRMLPCRTLDHLVYMLGVKDVAELRQRIDGRMLNIQEIITLEKAFLQTFAKRASLERIYGDGPDAGLMMDLHVPQLRRETLALLRKLHETEPERVNRATEALNEEETPQHNEVRRWIDKYVCRRSNPPDVTPPA